MEYEAVIGLEVHAQLSTESKIFCSCSTKFGAEPNSQVCPICLGMPGVLPVLNKRALEYASMAAIATNCTVHNISRFDRKNYFYPDLPKGYQITQYEQPICTGGYLDIDIDGSTKKIRITRIHMEEDAGKLIHEDSEHSSHVDLNRTGVPLIEIVSEPDMSNADEAVAYMKKLRSILTFIGVCDGNMEEGSLRCDANISVRPKGTDKLGTKAEIKNVNSFRFVQKAIEYEIERQISVLESGGEVVQETRLFDSGKNVTFSMRSKEEAHDYRYFPDPDLLPVVLEQDVIDSLTDSLPELPESRRKRFAEEYGLPESNALILTSTKALADYFEQSTEFCNDPKIVANWIINEVLREIGDEDEIDNFQIRPAELSKMLGLVKKGTISGKIAKDVFSQMIETGKSAEQIVKDKGLEQISDEGELESLVGSIVNKHPDEVRRFKDGDEKLLGFFVGQVMKETKGKANPKVINELLKKRLG
ncbi:MAG: Asp-tRNA(Asn)/Glu-tRNA(Gln) amidotransferase subunit GatB [Candidatus Dadabacteria bacterium]|nr:Asp-tRNA(Asn)/Glu-tRNA(Gln) amidotransferase subunit GatB [Candidatus Dadabacteria bacterium]NIS08348.1 Asp-tRNA(Asn)/Glu-tRNA(Gln) amidotransferase subunit GatB [Candidatus Dadabacteria bacterium]NIY21868.1 Asp-tRNA(Asn)/Glu-tRNA(Gln) amidotransferase subunit GatB [Candidatus Dadabacteria bacterium]